MSKTYRSLYHVELVYDGPEEGGRWHTNYKYIHGILVTPDNEASVEAAERALEMLADEKGITLPGLTRYDGGENGFRPLRDYRSASPEVDGMLLYEEYLGQHHSVEGYIPYE